MQSDTKLFVGGLTRDTVEATLIEYFQSFGEVIDCVIMKDKGTGVPRGFGFVTFKEPYQKDMDTLPHFINNKEVDVRPAETKNHSNTSDTKIFVGGLTANTVEATLIEYFQFCGEVIDCVVMKDKGTGEPRGFGFVTFKEHSQFKEAVGINDHIIDGKQVDVKPAKAKNSGDHFRGRGSHFGSRGGNYGSRGGHFGNTDGGGAYGGPSGGRYGGPYGGPSRGPYGGPSGGPYGGPSRGSYGYPN